jgi:hypothetical protein
MNSTEFEHTTIDLEKRLQRASMLHHKCLGIVLEKFLNKEEGTDGVPLRGGSEVDEVVN